MFHLGVLKKQWIWHVWYLLDLHPQYPQCIHRYKCLHGYNRTIVSAEVNAASKIRWHLLNYALLDLPFISSTISFSMIH